MDDFGAGDWQSLAVAVKRGACILMLGPDAVTAAATGEPLLTGLAARLAAELAPDRHVPPEEGLWAVAQAVLADDDRNALYGPVLDYLQNTPIDPAPLAPLARLPFSLVVNTVPGAPVEEVWRAADAGIPGRATQVAYYNFRTSTAVPPPPERDRPVVYHLFGSRDDEDSLVLADSDLLDFLVKVIAPETGLPPVLSGPLGDHRKSFLFLGFRLGHWPLRVLMRALAFENRRPNRSYALEVPDRSPDASTIQFYKRGHNVSFYPLDVEGFAEELERQVGADPLQHSGRAPYQPADDPNAKVVFLSYAREDKKLAERLKAALERIRLRVWTDFAELRAGKWEAQIEAALRYEGEADYMVLLHTPALVEKVEGYVNKEIKLGLKRQDRFRDSSGRSFLIPVTIGKPADLVPEVADLHIVELQSADDAQPILDAIRAGQ